VPERSVGSKSSAPPTNAGQGYAAVNIGQQSQDACVTLTLE